MKTHSKLTVTKQIHLSYFVCGLLWIAVGVFSQVANNTSLVIEAMVSIVCILISVFMLSSKKEALDEMALTHLQIAKSSAFDFMCGLLCVLVVVFMFLPSSALFQLSLKGIMFLCFGAGELFVGILFRKLENE